MKFNMKLIPFKATTLISCIFSRPLQNQIQEKQLKWFGHFSRTDSNRKPKQLLEAKPIGRKRKGKPRHTWKDGIIKMGQEKGKSYKEMRVLAKDRGKWRDWTEDPTPQKA
jgi:hypothetical protein